jgi:hypothetical protein
MAGEQRVPADAKMAFIVLLVLAAIAAILDIAIIGWLVGLICILLAMFAIFRAPLRATMLTLMFFALVLENPAEGPASGQWETPFLVVGALMLQHFKSTIGFGPIGGMDVMLLTTTVVLFLRGRRGRGPLGTPQPMIRLAQLTFVTIVFTFLVGKWRGGQMSFALWQIDRVIYLPWVFLLCQAAFTQPKDYLSVGKVMLGAATLRAAQAIWVRMVVPATDDPLTGESTLPYATTHNDSMLFATGFVALVALVLNRAGPKYLRLVWVCGPILFWGMLANHRRIVWVEIILVIATIYLMTDMNAFKRKLNKLALIMTPIVAGYVAVGWGSQAGVFKPVRVIRSAVDSSSDMSTMWRDLENFNLVFTLRQFPVTGVGYGNGFWEMWPMPPVPYDLERYIPHNSILGLFCYGGFLGYAGITALWVGGVFFCIRAYHHCKAPLEKAAALAALAAILVYYLQCFGDMGLGSWTGVYLVAPAIAIACKLTVASGAWDMAWQFKLRSRRTARGFTPTQASR